MDSSRIKPAIAPLVLAALVLTFLAPQAQANVARVEFSIGDVSGIDGDGRQRRLAKGSVLSAGDTVHTRRGRAQIRFTDGGYTSLQPNTEFRIDDYHYDEKKTEESVGFFSLLKGGLRTITGVIGKIRKKAYQLRTPVATVGIRGTEYLAVLGNSLTVHVGDGEIDVCTQEGCTAFGSHQTGYVASAGSQAVLTEHPPSLAPPQERQVYEYNGGYQAQFDAAADFRSGDGDPGNPLPNGTLYALAVSWGQSAFNSDLFARGLFSPTDSLTSASFDGNAGLADYFNGFGAQPVSGDVGSAQIADIGYANGPVGWGRWTMGGANVGLSAGGSRFVDLNGSSSHHYVVGIPTAVMPTNSASYSLVGGTRPTLASGAGAPGTLNSANMFADFGAGTVSLDMDMTVNGNNYVTSNLPMTLGNAPNNFTFSGGGITNSTGCVSTCFTSVEGFFAGVDASHAGLAYKTDLGGSDVINGAAGFKKN